MNENEITWNDGTQEEVKKILTDAIESRRTNSHGQRLRIFLGDAATGKDWGEENDVIGYIGLSMGPKRIPLLIASTRSLGGSGISTSCIVKIMDVATYKVLYQHPTYQCPRFEVRIPTMQEHEDGWVALVYKDDELYARFKGAWWRATHLVQFLRGERFHK